MSNFEEKKYKKNVKEKKFKEYDDDLLIDDSGMISASQKWYVMASADLDPNYDSLKVIHDFEIFSRHEGSKEVIKEYLNNKKYDMDFLLRYFQIFRNNEKNRKILDKKFKEHFPKYSSFRMMKFLGAFSDKKREKKRADEISKRADMRCVRVYTYQSGFWVPFHPTGAYLTDITYREKNMQEIMSSSINNQIKVANDFKSRRMILIERERRSKKEIDGPYKKVSSGKKWKKNTNNEIEDLNDEE
jgi:hypothetical protein